MAAERRAARAALALAGVAALVATTLVLVAAGTPAGAAVTGITWTRAPAFDQPKGNSEGQSVVVGDRLYSFGGFDVDQPCCTPTRRAYVLDPATGWRRIADLPVGLTHGGFATDGTDVFYAGGYVEAPGGGQAFGTTAAWRYSPATDAYTRLPDLPGIVAGAALVWLDGDLHLLGGTTRGRTPGDASDVVDLREHWVLDVAAGATTWVPAPPLPEQGRTHFAAVVLGGRIWAVGGQQGHDGPGSPLGPLVPLGRVDVYDPATATWATKAPLVPARDHHMSTTTVVDGRIIVMGGQVHHGESVADVDSYDPATDTWSTLTPLPVPRHSAVGGYLAGELWFSTGGFSAETYIGTLQHDGQPAGRPPAAPARFVPVAPTRLVDTRTGLGAPTGPIADGGTLDVVVAGRAGVPSGATAVVLNVTATGGRAPGYVQVLPTGQAPGGSSTLNLDGSGQPVANLAVVRVGDGGAISVHVQVATDVVIDVSGAFVPSGSTRSGRLVPLTPTRVLDTRIGLGAPAGPVGAGGQLVLDLPGVPEGAAAVVLNVTATDAAAAGWVQALPAGRASSVGASSNVNVAAGGTAANLVAVGVTDGQVLLAVQSATQLVADVVGYVTGPGAATSSAGRFVAADPVRVLDTRTSARPGDGGQVLLPVPGLPGVPGDAGALLLNLTATEATAPGFVQVAPAGDAVLGRSSTLNVVPGQTVANAVVAPTTGGGAAVLVQSSTQLVCDLSGWFTGGG